MTDTARADLLIGDILARIHAAIAEHDVTYEEFQTAKQWLIDVGQAGEWPLFLDVFVEHAVEKQVYESRRGTQGTILGPYHLPDAPLLDAPYELPRRADEEGDHVVFSGRVTGEDGEPLRAPSSTSGTPTRRACTPASTRRCPRASCAARSSPTTTAATRSARSSRRRTRSPRTARPARWSTRPAGARGVRRTST